MQINPKYTKNRPFLPALSQSSKVTPVKKWDALGINTNFCSNQAQQGLQPDELKYKEYRKLTQGLKERAGEILYTPNSKKQDFRVCNCGKLRIDKELPVDVRYDADKNRASFGNLQYCGSVWTCPDCSKKVSLAKKELIAQAVTSANAKGLHVAMLTLTIPHYLGDDLKDLLTKMKKAKNYLFTNRNSREWFAQQFPITGEITATEVKYSDRNGFHPHLHILLFLDREYQREDIQRIEGEIYDFWAEKCVKRGLGKPSRKHGVDLKMEKTGEQTFASYIAKWGLASELTQSHMKIGKRNMSSLTMWEVLELAQMEASTKDKYSHIFRTYAKAFKGARQIRPSNGLLELLGLKNIEDDEELANQKEEESSQIYDALSLSDQDWWTLCYHKKRVEFLELVESDFARDGIQSELKSAKDFLFGLKNAPRFSRGQGEKFPCS
jgi:plasmid rolling circle replication initiator protein Rep